MPRQQGQNGIRRKMGTKTPGDLRSGRKATTKGAGIEFVGCRTTKGVVWEE